MNVTKRRGSSRGFTLIEIMVTVAIIAILVAAILAALDAVRGKARDSKRISEIKQLEGAIENYFTTCYDYPTIVRWKTQLMGSGACAGYKATLPQIPNDVNYQYYTDAPDGIGKRFHLCTTLDFSYGSNKGKAGAAPFGAGDLCDGRIGTTFDVTGGAY